MTTRSPVALITGASRGLGAALARQLAAAGYAVVAVARPSADLGRVVREIRAAGGQAWPVAEDLGDPDAATRIAARASALAGPVDLLIHNASTLGPTPLRPLLDTAPADFERVLQVNLLGPFRLTRAVAGQMDLRGQGTVLTLSSDAAVEAYPTWGAYGVSKAALDHLVRIWAQELPHVRFVAVDPTEMDTAMHAAALPDADPATLADPRDIAARVVALLATDTPTGTRTVAA